MIWVILTLPLKLGFRDEFQNLRWYQMPLSVVIWRPWQIFWQLPCTICKGITAIASNGMFIWWIFYLLPLTTLMPSKICNWPLRHLFLSALHMPRLGVNVFRSQIHILTRDIWQSFILIRLGQSPSLELVFKVELDLKTQTLGVEYAFDSNSDTLQI